MLACARFTDLFTRSFPGRACFARHPTVAGHHSGSKNARERKPKETWPASLGLLLTVDLEVSSHEANVLSEDEDVLPVLFRDLDGFEELVRGDESDLLGVAPLLALCRRLRSRFPALQRSFPVHDDGRDLAFLDPVLAGDDGVVA